MNIALIVAAGSGSRFAADKPKQFIDLLGRPLIIHTLQRIDSCPTVDEIVLVLSEAGRNEFEALDFKIKKLRSVVPGGATRAESVRNGLSSLQASDGDIVAVHDGARPLVSAAEVAEVIAKTKETGAACLVAPVNDTIKSVSGGEITATLDRNTLRRAMTPQAFRLGLLRQGFALFELTEAVTDECYLVEKLGHPIAIVEGNARNIKVTTREDLLFVEAILKFES